jgi:beta-glucosidase-like glycosyl hydrolase
MQGNHSKYVMVGATCKHFLANSLESWQGFSRHNFDAQISAADLADYYLPAFEGCVREGGALGVMCSYNSVNGIPMCASAKLLNGLLRGRWNASVYVTSDCGAITDIFEPVPRGHGFASDNLTAAVDGLRAGTDLDCDTFSKNHVYNTHAAEAVNRSLLPVAVLDAAVENLVAVQMRLGLFDNNKPQQPYAQLPPSLVGSAEHQALSRDATRQSLILLKNDPLGGGGGVPVLPLKWGLKLAVIGKHFNSTKNLISDYAGPLCHLVDRNASSQFDCIESPVEALKRLNIGGQTVGTHGCCSYGLKDNITAAVALARHAEAVVLMVGLTGSDEGEGHDREQTTLCQAEQQLVAAREKQIRGSGVSLEPPRPLLELLGPLLTHLHTVYIAYSECLPTRLPPG